MPINEALFAAMKAASYIKPNAGKSYKLQRVAEELIAKQAPDNPKCRVEDAFAPMADGYAVPLRVFTPLSPMERPCPKPWRNLPPMHARGLGNIRDSARRITQSPTQNTHQGKHVERQRRRYFPAMPNTELPSVTAAWHDPVFPRWRLDHRRHQPVHAGLRAYGRTSATPCDLSRVPAGS